MLFIRSVGSEESEAPTHARALACQLVTKMDQPKNANGNLLTLSAVFEKTKDNCLPSNLGRFGISVQFGVEFPCT